MSPLDNRRPWKRTRRVVRGHFVIICMAGTTAVVKIRIDDAARIEDKPGRSIEDLDKIGKPVHSLMQTFMRKLGIKNYELTNDDEDELDRINEE